MGRFSHRSLWLACCGLWLGPWLSSAAAEEVWLVTDSQQPVTVPETVRVIQLNAPARLQAQLNADLPAEAERAADLVRARLQQPATHRTQLTKAWQGLVEAWQLGIHTLPAVVVDRRYVVYGTADIEAAVARIDAYRHSKP